MRQKILLITILATAGLILCASSAFAFNATREEVSGTIEASGNGAVNNVIAGRNAVLNVNSYDPEMTNVKNLDSGKYIPECDPGDSECQTQILRVIDPKE